MHTIDLQTISHILSYPKFNAFFNDENTYSSVTQGFTMIFSTIIKVLVAIIVCLIIKKRGLILACIAKQVELIID